MKTKLILLMTIFLLLPIAFAITDKEISIDKDLKDIASKYDMKVKTFEGNNTIKYSIYDGKQIIFSEILKKRNCVLSKCNIIDKVIEKDCKSKIVCINIDRNDIDKIINDKVKALAVAKAEKEADRINEPNSGN